MAIITLTTDFGRKDYFVAAIKGRILSEVADTTVVDISHEISPFDIHECAYILKHVYQEFPQGTIHIIGMDSEVSPENEHIITQLEGHYFISANNGVPSLIANDLTPEKILEIDLPNTPPTAFPELEVFTKVACHLARGGKPEVVGKPFKKLKEVKDFVPRITNEGSTIVGNVIYIDHYGNVVTNIRKSLFEAYRNGRPFEILARTASLKSVYERYNQIIDFKLPKNQRKGPSDFLALFNAAGYLELAIYKSDLKTVGGAASLIGLEYRDTITVNFL